MKIIHSLILHEETILITRVNNEKAHFICETYPQLVHHATAQIVCTSLEHITKTQRQAAIICAGTSDLPVAEEAAITAEVMGISVKDFTMLEFLVSTVFSLILMIFAIAMYL